MSEVPYASVVGRLMYVMVRCRPDMSFAIGLFSKFMRKLGIQH